MARRPNPYLTDDENPELSLTDIAAMKLGGDVLPTGAFDALVDAEPKRKRGQRGAGKKAAKVAFSIRVEPTILDAWRKSGDGWQRRLNAVIAREAPKAKGRA